MTDQEREKVERALSQKIKSDGFVKLSSLLGVVREVGFDRTLYNGKKPKLWIADEFEKFMVTGSNGHETIRFSNDPVAKAWKVLNNAVEQEGKILLANISPLLKKHGLDYKELAGSKNLKDWLHETFPDYAVSEDNLWLFRSGAPVPVSAVVSVAKNEDVQSPEVQQMHRAAFMDWWSTNVRRLRAYNEELSSESVVRETIARQFARVMLGEAAGVVDGREESSTVAFDSGLKSTDGEVIYCVLIPNPREDGKKQKWILSGFACTSDATPMGAWLKEHIRPDAGSSITFSMLEEKTLEVGAAMQALLPGLQEYLQTMQLGRLPKHLIAGSMEEFEKQAEELQQMYQELWHKEYPDDLSLEQVSEQNRGTQGIQHAMEHALELFDQIMDATEALFLDLHLNVCTPSIDREKLHRQYENVTAGAFLALFEGTLQAYEVLLEVMSSSVYSDALGDKVENVLCPHFQEITERFAMRCLMNSPQSDWEFLKELANVRGELTACEDQLSQLGSHAGEKKSFTPEELLDACLRAKRDVLALAAYAAEIFPENEKEQALVLASGRLDERLPEALTYYAAAMRLYHVIGNRDGLAEKYLILGLSTDEEHCVPALLKLYREEQREADFKRIMELFSDEQETGLADQMFYLDILCREAPQRAWGYAQKYIYLSYQKECMEMLLALPEGAIPQEERQVLSERLRSYEVYQQPNELERALLAGEQEKVRELAGQKEQLLQLGYSAENVQQIVEAAQKEVAAGDGQQQDYGKGVRLYRFQGNIHGLAERCMWKGIAEDRTFAGKHLMALLSGEERWEECCRLYECFQTRYSAHAVCRQLYLVALLRMDSSDTREYVRKNLQECLLLMGNQNSTAVFDTVNELAQSGTREQRDFYGCIRQLADELAVPIVKNIVLMERTLREYATPESAREAGLPDEYVNGILNVYKSDSYPHGGDALSIAKRAYCFFGAYRGVAECAAKLALPDVGAAELLWKLYDRLGEENLQFALMQQYTDLQESHGEMYADLLFQKAAYEEFLSVCDGADGSWGHALQVFIAELKLNPSASVSLPPSGTENLQEELTWYEHWGCLLVETLYQAGRVADVGTVLEAGFVKWTAAYPKELLNALVTGSETATEAALLTVQEHARKAGSVELALYIYNVLQIGDLKAESDAFFAECTREYQAVSSTQQMEALQKLRAIYGDAVGEVNANIALIRIGQLREQEGLSLETADEVAGLLDGFPSGGQFLEDLLSRLDQADACCAEPVYHKLAGLAETQEQKQAVLKFFNRQALLGKAIEHRDYIQWVCMLDADAMEQGCFPQETFDDARTFCMACVERYKSVEAIWCLYEIERMMGRTHYADYLLCVLDDQAGDAALEETDAKVKAQIEKQWPLNTPSYFELLKSCLADATIEEMEQYISYAHMAARVEWSSSVLLQTEPEEMENRMLTEKDSNALIRQLYLNPTDVKLWKRCTGLPLQDNPAGYAKWLLLTCMHQTGNWESCADYCEKYEQDELLLRVLATWAKSTAESEAVRCRKYLESQLESRPDYFEPWKGRAQLQELSVTICDQARKSQGEYYATICAAALIAEKTGSVGALDYLLEVFRDVLFGSGCNIGVALAVNLLLDERYEEAQMVFGRLKNVLMNMNYRELVNELAEKSVDELKIWRQDTKNVIMLRMIPFDGNRPSLERINEITFRGIEIGQAKETAAVITDMLDMFPGDYGAYNALYNLSCTQFEDFLPALHKSLRGLVTRRPSYSAGSYYRRGQMQYAHMLAALDALLFVNGSTEQLVDYELDTATQKYRWNLQNVSLTAEELAAAAMEEERIRDAFENRGPEEKRLLTEAYLSCITGNWRSLIRMVQNKEAPLMIKGALNCSLNASVEDIGFARSLFAVLLTLPKDARMPLIDSLKEILGVSEGGKKKTRRQQQLVFVELFLKEGYFGRLEEQIELEPLGLILESTFEDYSYCMHWKKQYVDSAVEKNADGLFELSLLVGGLVCHEGLWNELVKGADRLFEKGNDLQAYSLYHAVYQLNRSFFMVHTDQKQIAMSRRFREYTEARYRVTALFSMDKAIMETVGASDFHVWSCINMILTLLYSGRNDEVLRLASYLNNGNAQLARILLRGMDPAVNPWEKWQDIDLLEDDAAKMYYCYVIKHPYNPVRGIENSFALGNGTEGKEIAGRINGRYLSLAKHLQEQKNPAMREGSLSPAHQILLGTGAVKEKISSLQKDPLQWSISSEMEDTSGQSDLEELPFYAQELEPLEGNESIGELKNRRGKLPNTKEYIEEKEALSRKIFQYCLGKKKCSSGERRDALLLLGNDHYYYALAMQDVEEANKTLLALAGIMKNVAAGAEYDSAGEEVKEMICDTGLHKLLLAPDSLKKLLDSYVENRSLYHYMRSVLKDALLVTCVGQIYAVLDNLKKCYFSVITENIETLGKELSANFMQLERIETNRWMDLKIKIQQLINDENNELGQRPVLQVEVLNEGIQRPYGYLYGQVVNVGQVAADQLLIQANYSDSSISCRYELKRLLPGARAAFEIDYSVSAELKELDYYINVSFSYGKKDDSSLVCKGTLKIGEVEPPQYPTGILSADANGMRFHKGENGEVYSPDFIGRKEETAAMRSLVDGDDFYEYKSALVYGIKRTGKTSLLDYLAAYIDANRTQVICVRIDCQTLPSTDFVQYVFVKYVCTQLEREERLRGLDETNEAWKKYKREWTDDFCADLHPEQLVLFYSGLKRFLGDYGLYLIIDEVDRLFECVEKRESNADGETQACNLDSLFGTISTILSSADCKKAVHVVLCGSNWLIRYNLTGDKTNQLFQRFGRQVIPVGRLPEEDAKAVVRMPYERYPEVKFSRQALDWIWDDAGGLVWHTKLLGDEALQRAKDAGRSEVYPSDVYESLPKVLNPLYCKQFRDACEGEENGLIEALQSLAAKKDSYVHVNKIRELLQWDSVKLQKKLSLLMALKIIEQHPINPQYYRFELDIYRRYFRREAVGTYPQIPEDAEMFRRKRQIEEALHVPDNAQSADTDDWDAFA